MEPRSPEAKAFVDSPIGKGLLSDKSLWFRLTNEAGEYLYVSPQVKVFLGYEPDEFRNLSGYDIIHPDEINVAGDALRALEDGPINAIYRMKHKDGEYIWVSSHLQKMGPIVLTLGRSVPERLQGFAWQHVDPFL